MAGGEGFDLASQPFGLQAARAHWARSFEPLCRPTKAKCPHATGI